MHEFFSLGSGLAPDLRRLRHPPSLDKLRQAQASDQEAQGWISTLKAGEKVTFPGGELRLDADLLAFHPAADETLRPSFLPSLWRRDVVFFIHRSKNHARGDRLVDYIARVYWWHAQGGCSQNPS